MMRQSGANIVLGILIGLGTFGSVTGASLSNSAGFKAVRDTYSRGEYEALIEYGLAHSDLDWRVHRVVAKAAGTQFFRYSRGDLRETTSYKQRLEQYKRLSERCTRHYEAAIAYPGLDQYTRSQLANEWTTFKVSGNFAADSKSLRRQFPTHPAFESRSSQNQIEIQTRRFQEAVRQAIRAGRQGRMFAATTRDEITQSLAAEFRVYARIGIPEKVFAEILRDLPFFFDEGLPLKLFEGKTKLSELAGTFTWYLWNAVIKPLPDEYERRQIREQLDCFNTIVAKAVEKIEMPETSRPEFESYLNKWYAMYEPLRENRFVPYFKRALPDFRLEKLCRHLEGNLSEITANLKRNVALTELATADGSSKNSIHETYRRTGFATLIEILVQYSHYDRPPHNPLPTVLFRQDNGTLNAYSVYTFVPGEGHPF